MESASNVPLPMLTAPIEANQINVSAISEDWIRRLTALFCSPKSDSLIADVLSRSTPPWWRDQLGLTWDLRTFNSVSRISAMLHATVPQRRPSGLSLIPGSSRFIAMGRRSAYIHCSFFFETDATRCSGIAKLVPEPDGQWRAWNVFTRLEQLKGYEEDASRLDVRDLRIRTDFDVVILGAGQCGLQTSAALRAIGMHSLIIEQLDRVGDQWRSHYDCLTTHLSKWYSQFSYRPYPESMPYYPSKDDLADFLEYYACSTNLNISTSSRIQSATYDKVARRWTIVVVRRDGVSTTLRAGHLVMATGIHGMKPVVPMIKNKNAFRGTTMHSTGYKNPAGWKGKKVIVVGVGVSGHDIADDLCNHGASVTMIQRRPTIVVSQRMAEGFFSQHYGERAPPVDIIDRVMESSPLLVTRRVYALIMASTQYIDEHMHRGLTQSGFRLKEPDMVDTIFNRYGGHYMDTGCSELIIEGRIKIKSGVPITTYTSKGLAFADGTDLPADLIVFATGFDLQSMRKTASVIIGDDEAKHLKDPWGLDEEGEVRGVWRDSGHPRLWYMGGDFKVARYYSKLLALQIKASQLGILSRYRV